MKRFWIAAVLVLVSGNAMAKRVLVEDSEEFVAYAESDTIQRSGTTARMSVLYDYKVKHVYLKWAYWSQRSLSEFDCMDKRAQTLQYVFYAGQMGGGEVILNGTVLPGLWSRVAQGSTVEKFWKLACGR